MGKEVKTTVFFAMGRERAEDYWRQHREFEMIMEDGGIYMTEGMKDRFKGQRYWHNSFKMD